MHSDSDLNHDYDCFIGILKNKIDKHFPLTRLSIRGSKDKGWITRGLKTSSRTKNRLYKKWVQSNSHSDEIVYKDYKRVFSRVVKQQQKSFYAEYFNNKRNKLKDIWHQINKLTGSRKSIKKDNNIPQLLVKNTIVDNKNDISNIFNHFFCSVGEHLAHSIPGNNNGFQIYLNNPVNETIFLEPINRYEIRNVISNLNIHKSCGPDKIGPRLITEIAEELLLPLEHIYNKSMLTGIVPENLKLAKVVPVYKKGSKTEVSNYRPISLLNTFNKIFEKLVYKSLLFYKKNITS